jgi:hypothetical protein
MLLYYLLKAYARTGKLGFYAREPYLLTAAGMEILDKFGMQNILRQK